MKILFMADVPPDKNSGAAGTEYQTIEAIRALGHDVDTVWADQLPHRITHGNLHYLLELPFAYRRQALARLEQQHYDVLHVNQPHGYLAARAVRKLNRKTAFIHRSHGLESRGHREMSFWLETYGKENRTQLRSGVSNLMALAMSHNCRSISRYADGHIVSCTMCRDFLVEQLKVTPARIAVVPQAPTAAFVGRSPAAMTPERLKRILYVGQFVIQKAPMILAGVFNRLSRLNPELEFTWVCSKQHHEEARSLVDDHARDRLTLLDWMQQDRLLEVYDQHGLFLFPSFFEGFGKVFLEAMSRGLCVVAADNGGAHDVISNGLDGLLTPTGDASAMTRECQRLISDPQEAIRMSRAAAETARGYTWARVARETVAFYENRLDARARQLTK